MSMAAKHFLNIKRDMHFDFGAEDIIFRKYVSIWLEEGGLEFGVWISGFTK